LAAPRALAEEMVFRTKGRELSADEWIGDRTLRNIKNLAASSRAIRGVDSAHALVDHVSSEGTRDAVNAKPKTGGERNPERYANRADDKSAQVARNLCPDGVAREPFAGAKVGSIRCVRSGSAGTSGSDSASPRFSTERLEAIGQTGMA